MTHLTMRALTVLAGLNKRWWFRDRRQVWLPHNIEACSLTRSGGTLVGWSSAKTESPTCPVCAVLADQALDLAAERMAARIERRAAQQRREAA